MRRSPARKSRSIFDAECGAIAALFSSSARAMGAGHAAKKDQLKRESMPVTARLPDSKDHVTRWGSAEPQRVFYCATAAVSRPGLCFRSETPVYEGLRLGEARAMAVLPFRP